MNESGRCWIEGDDPMDLMSPRRWLVRTHVRPPVSVVTSLRMFRTVTDEVGTPRRMRAVRPEAGAIQEGFHG